ncbi:hypothetical protein [Halobaculum sp. P14]|uniref:hypothetical protein n=1 Tax=Halobaculum sp. P14 TaxID=3421638 RepID=UPI003EB7FA96
MQRREVLGRLGAAAATAALAGTAGCLSDPGEYDGEPCGGGPVTLAEIAAEPTAYTTIGSRVTVTASVAAMPDASTIVLEDPTGRAYGTPYRSVRFGTSIRVGTCVNAVVKAGITDEGEASGTVLDVFSVTKTSPDTAAE